MFLYFFIDVFIVSLFVFAVTFIFDLLGVKTRVSEIIITVFLCIFLAVSLIVSLSEPSFKGFITTLLSPFSFLNNLWEAIRICFIMLCIGFALMLVYSFALVAAEFAHAFIRSRKNHTTLYEEFGRTLDIIEESEDEVKYENKNNIQIEQSVIEEKKKEFESGPNPEEKQNGSESSACYYRISGSKRFGKKEGDSYFLSSGNKWVKDIKGTLKKRLEEQGSDDGLLVNRISEEEVNMITK